MSSSVCSVQTVKGENMIIIGLFNKRETAEAAYLKITESGWPANHLNVMMSSDTREKLFGGHESQPVNNDILLHGIKTGSTTGGILGGLAAVIGALGSNLLIPGLGLVALGPLAAGLLGAGVGGLGGGLVGALLTADVPQEKAAVYDEGIKNGKIVIGLDPETLPKAKLLEEIFKDCGAEEVYIKC